MMVYVACGLWGLIAGIVDPEGWSTVILGALVITIIDIICEDLRGVRK